MHVIDNLAVEVVESPNTFYDNVVEVGYWNNNQITNVRKYKKVLPHKIYNTLLFIESIRSIPCTSLNIALMKLNILNIQLTYIDVAFSTIAVSWKKPFMEIIDQWPLSWPSINTYVTLKRKSKRLDIKTPKN